MAAQKNPIIRQNHVEKCSMAFALTLQMKLLDILIFLCCID